MELKDNIKLFSAFMENLVNLLDYHKLGITTRLLLIQIKFIVNENHVNNEELLPYKFYFIEKPYNVFIWDEDIQQLSGIKSKATLKKTYRRLEKAGFIKIISNSLFSEEIDEYLTEFQFNSKFSFTPYLVWNTIQDEEGSYEELTILSNKKIKINKKRKKK